MKKVILLLAITILSSTLILAQEETKIDLENSTVKWLGSKLFSFGEHYGIVKLKDGNLIISDGEISGGTFIIDMNTIANTDGDYSQNLVDHLKDSDFFDVINYPTATINITAVEEDEYSIDMIIIADLTIKATTLPIKFNARLNPENSNQITAKFIIDRSRWNINFGSPGITNIQDNVISDAIVFEISLITI